MSSTGSDREEGSSPRPGAKISWGKVFTLGFIFFFLMPSAAVHADQSKNTQEQQMSKTEDVRMVSPALAKYAQHTLFGDLWKRPELTPRDRCIVTVAALIARGQTAEMPDYFARALDNGVKPGRTLRDHHASRILFRLGERDVGHSCRAGGLQKTRDRRRSAAFGRGCAFAARRGRRSAARGLRREGVRRSRAGSREVHRRAVVQRALAASRSGSPRA